MDNSEVYKESIGKLLKETDDINFQIRKLMYENQELTAENNKEIGEFKNELAETEAAMEKTLAESGEEAIKPKCGWAHFKAMKDKIVIEDEAKTIEEIKEKLPSFADLLIKYVETYSIGRKELNQLIRDETIRIEVLETVTVEKQEKKFEYKYTGGK